MKKLLTVLFILPLIFSSCEKEEETQSNNNNNSSDVIIGSYVRLWENPNGYYWHLDFYPNNTYEDVIYFDDGSISDYIQGTWENLGGGVYYLVDDWEDYTITLNFYCDDNVIDVTDSGGILGEGYYIKDNYDVQSCSEINL
jgi:hypothetical protein